VTTTVAAPPRTTTVTKTRTRVVLMCKTNQPKPTPAKAAHKPHHGVRPPYTKSLRR
jgi:hypothetical protein